MGRDVRRPVFGVSDKVSQSYVYLHFCNSELEYVLTDHLLAKALGLIMGSRVDTSGDNQNAVR